ncbi:MAG: formylglycine-generating enzyme family protein [Deltaproteobacteria bacterium]|nr:MAG: formylglycine-generating enzyme family protein [Deltaproteobacteria bacterium]
MDAVALPSTCGPAGTDSCCNSPLIDGGMYFRSYDVANDHSSGKLIGEPVDMNSPATVTGFRLDKYEVTVGRFRAFVAAGQGTLMMHPAAGDGTHPRISGSGWEAAWNASLTPGTTSLMAALKCTSTNPAGFATWTDTPGSNENRPINCISWYEAMAFCAWDGGYLPTETEWNYAATGGSQQRAYPWSNPPSDLTVDALHASYADGTSDNPDCHGDGMPGCALTDIVNVGTKSQGDGRWGQSDLAGNLDEWVLDYNNESTFYVNPCTDCAYLTVSRYRVLRGGDYRNNAIFMRTAVRTSNPPQNRAPSFGFRCARTP